MKKPTEQTRDVLEEEICNALKIDAERKNRNDIVNARVVDSIDKAFRYDPISKISTFEIQTTSELPEFVEDRRKYDFRCVIPRTLRGASSREREYELKSGYELPLDLLKALVFIPEDHNSVKVERLDVRDVRVGKRGFLTPKYTPEAANAVKSAVAKTFAGDETLERKLELLDTFHEVLPDGFDGLKALSIEKEQIIKGITNFRWGYTGENLLQMNKFDCLVHILEKMGFAGSKDADVVRALWNKSKQLSGGYGGTRLWAFLADHILAKEPQILLQSPHNILLGGIARKSLAHILKEIPVNPCVYHNPCAFGRSDKPQHAELLYDKLDKILSSH